MTIVSQMQLFDLVCGNTCTCKILIFGHVLLFYIENIIEKKNPTYNVTIRVRNQECDKAIRSLQADKSLKCR